jgi:hypothetical protein
MKLLSLALLLLMAPEALHEALRQRQSQNIPNQLLAENAV